MQMKTYEIGLHLANSYRALKGRTNKILKEFEISAFEWALLGLLNESDSGLRVSIIAEKLFVSKAMVSKTCRKLADQALITQAKNFEKDKRAVAYTLTSTGNELLLVAEKKLRGEFKSILNKTSKIDLLLFYKTSSRISKNLHKDIDTSATQ